MVSVQQANPQSSLQQAAVVTLVLASCLVSSAMAETKKEFRFTVGPKANISVDTQYGAISVKPGTGNQVVVSATLQSDKVEVDNQQMGNRIEIASHQLQGSDQKTGRVDYELLIPADATLSIHSSAGPLSAERLQGDLTLEGADDPVTVREVSNGHVHVLTMGGSITMTDIRNGHVEISSINGDVHMKSVSGPLVQADTSHGKIFYDGDFGSGGEYKFTTHNGDIEALVPVNVSADFKAHSMLGRVQHDFPLKTSHTRFTSQEGSSFFGTSGKAASDVILRSFSGKIRLKQR
jgi:DUF4097 and DUF4098 domain-containing protein YvlB